MYVCIHTKRKHQIPTTHFQFFFNLLSFSLLINLIQRSPWCNRSSMTKPKSFLEKFLKPFKSLSSDKDTNNEEDLQTIAAQEQKEFSFDKLASATRNFHFSNKLGEGGFGPVYKGKLEDGREIAVKKLARNSRQGEKEFINEARLLARVQHKNIVNLLGYCAHGVDYLLVYEYLPRQSLDKFLIRDLKKREELDWKKRYDIILGVAKGLVYLHEDSHICIIHRDIKAGNILLDDKWAPKIADFGMARLFPEDETHVNTRVAGTNGYMAPEYVMHGKLSSKADVFSFGVLVLELISGQKNSTFNADPDGHSLLEWAWNHYKEGRSLEIMDITLASTEAVEQVKTCIQIGLLCCQPDPTFRPLMRRVILMLSKKPSSLEEPQKPGYLGSRYRRPHRSSGSSSVAGSSGLSPHSKPAHVSSIAGSSGSSSDTFNSTSNTGSAIRYPLHRSHGKQTREFSSSTFNSTSNTGSAGRSPPHCSHGKKPMQD